MKNSKERSHLVKSYNESDFVSTSTLFEPPRELSEVIFENMNRYVKPDLKFLSIKYSIVFVFSGFLSLLLCPQKGFGFLQNYPLFFHIFHSNILLCGLYCGVFFAGLTHVSAMIFLNYFERLALYNSLRFLPHVWFGLSFGVFMYLGEDYYRLDLYYNLSWVLAAIFVVWASQKIKIQRFSFY